MNRYQRIKPVKNKKVRVEISGKKLKCFKRKRHHNKINLNIISLINPELTYTMHLPRVK